jgi:hypothetical protein
VEIASADGVRISLSGHEVQGDALKIVYILEIGLNDELWRLSKRYSEFDALRKALEKVKQKADSDIPEKMPGKHMTGSNSDKVIAERKTGLGKWVEAIMKTPWACRSKVFAEFCEATGEVRAELWEEEMELAGGALHT